MYQYLFAILLASAGVASIYGISLNQLNSIKLKPVKNGAVNAVKYTSAYELLNSKSSFPFSKPDPILIFAVRRPG